MNLSEKDISIIKGISLVSGLFTLLIAITMIFSLIQLKTMDPINSPALNSVKEQYDRDPDNRDKAEQVRAMDLMARKAYFTSRWQVETGSYLLIAGALIFVLSQRIITSSEKMSREAPGARPDISSERRNSRRIIMIAAGAVAVLAIVSSFILRKDLPSPGSAPVTAEKNIQPSEATGELIHLDEVNYPFFRGEGSRGLAGGSGYPTEWNGSDGTNIKWKIPVPRPGKSSPVIWGDKLFITGAGNGLCEVTCIDKTNGNILWTGSASGFPGASSEEPESDAEAGMAVPTAAACREGVCAIFGNGNLVFFEFNGKLKWGKNIGVPQTTYGFSASLLIHENLVLVQYDSNEKIAIAGFDISTGEKRWETPRNGRPVNSSPVLAIFDGQWQVIINGNPNVTSFDPVTGKELWSLPGVSGDVAPSLAVNNKLVYTTTDYYKLLALKPGTDGSTMWEDNSFTPDVSSPVATNKYLFIATGSGDAVCYNAEKGDTLWSHYFGDPFYASPIVCDGKVWMLDREGNMHVAEASGSKKVISSSPLGEKTDCTPAFSEKRIYIRGIDNLYCIAIN